MYSRPHELGVIRQIIDVYVYHKEETVTEIMLICWNACNHAVTDISIVVY